MFGHWGQVAWWERLAKYHHYFDSRENILGQLIPVPERFTWQEEHCHPSDWEKQGDCTGLSFKDREEVPLLNRTMMCPDPLSNVRLPLHLTSSPIPKPPCCLIVFATRDIAGGNYRCDLSGYLQDTECI